MTAALGQSARQTAATFRRAAERLAASSLEIASFILMRAYTQTPSGHADEALNLLIDQPARLGIGYVQDTRWLARQLVEHNTPSASNESLRRLEELLVKYFPPYERTAQGRDFRGWSQFTLLSAIPDDRIGPAASAALGVWQRKFQLPAPPAPLALEASFVGPPIPPARASMMSDEQWLRAIARYTEEWPTRDRPIERSGGVHQLAGLLQSETTRAPARFARLLLRFDDDVRSQYFDAVLRGVAEHPHDVPSSLLDEIVLRCQRLPGRPVGRALSHLVEKVPAAAVRPAVRSALAWHATSDPDPEQAPTDGDLFTHGINSVRGAAAEAISKVTWEDPEQGGVWATTIEQVLGDRVASVRACIAEALTASLRVDRAAAVKRFLKLAGHPDDGLLATPPVLRFLRYAVVTHLLMLSPVLERMLQSPIDNVRLEGSRMAAWASLHDESAAGLIAEAVAGDPSLRQGVADVYAANLADAEPGGPVATAVGGFFVDDALAVRAAAAACWDLLEEHGLGRHTDLVAVFVESPSFADSHHHLVSCLMKAVRPPAGIVLTVVEGFVRQAGNAAGDISSGWSGDARSLSQLLIGAYAGSHDDDTRRRMVDLVDDLLRVGAYGAEEMLQAIERDSGA